MTDLQETLERLLPRRMIEPPSLKARLWWWFTIYGSGVVAVTVHAIREYLNLNAVIVFPLLFPLPFGFMFVPLINLLPYSAGKYLIVPCFFFGYVFYAWHLHATLKAATRRRFDLLLLLLVIAVLMNELIVITMPPMQA